MRQTKMKRFFRNILMIAAAAAPVASAMAANDPAAAAKPLRGSVAAQLMLKIRLQKINSGTLAASLNHNRVEWESLLPEQREQFRREAVAFLEKNPQEQQRLVEYYGKFIALSADKRKAYVERAKWLKVVIESLSQQERKDLEQMTPEQRAKILLDRKAQLLREGKLPAEGPTTQPAAPPTTQP